MAPAQTISEADQVVSFLSYWVKGLDHWYSGRVEYFRIKHFGFVHLAEVIGGSRADNFWADQVGDIDLWNDCWSIRWHFHSSAFEFIGLQSQWSGFIRVELPKSDLYIWESGGRKFSEMVSQFIVAVHGTADVINVARVLFA